MKLLLLVILSTLISLLAFMLNPIFGAILCLGILLGVNMWIALMVKDIHNELLSNKTKQSIADRVYEEYVKEKQMTKP
ncbi:hypothetical protein BTS2_1345 [Bacillus sp. TS-2]|nr:hypothetical protein BTS2_1345 [Bacillus sp. TS-2]